MPGINELAYKLATDTNERFIIQDDGKMLWGSGSAIADVIMSRTGAGQVTLTGSFVSGAQASPPTVAAGTGYSAASLSAASTDTAMALTYTATAVGPTNPAMTITFGATHAAAPKSITFSAASIFAAPNTGQLYVVSSSATGFVLGTATTDGAHAQTWDIHVDF
jgi:hypothetical protein